MTTIKLLQLLNQQNIKVFIREGKLQIKAPKGAMTEEIDVALKANKEQLIQYLDNTKKHELTIETIDKSLPQPLSFAQQRCWFIEQMYGCNSLCNTPFVFDVKGNFNIKVAEKAFSTIIERHEVLRTIYIKGEQEPLQKITHFDGFNINVINIESLTKNQKDDKIKQIIDQEINHVYRLEKDMMIRVSFIISTAQSGLLLLNMHHMVSDGWSHEVLIKELVTLYDAYLNNHKHDLAPLPIQYSDYAQWQRQQIISKRYESHRDFWLCKLKNLPQTHDLPMDYERPKFQTYHGNSHRFIIEPSLTASLNELVLAHEVTLFMLLHSVFSVLLWRYSNNTDVVIGTPIAHRQYDEFESLIGCFINFLVLRTDCSNNPRFIDYLNMVKQTNLEAQSHQDLPFEQIVDAINPDKSTSYHPLFQVMFTMDNHLKHSIDLSGVELIIRPQNEMMVKFDFIFNAINDHENGMICDFQYNAELFKSSTIESFAKSFVLMLEAISTDSNQRIAHLPILSEQQKYHLIKGLNQTHKDYDMGLCIHKRVEQHALKAPHSIAVVAENMELNYQQLNFQANQLANYLLTLGYKPGGLIGVIMNRGVDMMVSILAVFKLRGAYVPIDPIYPQKRLNYMIKDSNVSYVLTHRKHQSKIFSKIDTIVLDNTEVIQQIASCSNQSPDVGSNAPSDLAYVIYTSGSTGQPKGVLIEQRSLLNLCQWHVEKYKVNINTKATHLASISFDAAIWEVWPYLISGSTIVVVDNDMRIDPNALLKCLMKNQITHCFLPTALLKTNMASLNSKENLSLKFVFTGGEQLSGVQLKRFNLINHYGPTEATVVSSSYVVKGEEQKSSPIGRGISNVRLLVLSEQQQLVPLGTIGELYIGGTGLARGYLNQQELTDKHFIDDPFNMGERLYKTGDLVRYRSDGELVFVGRVDDQVKIRGFRIELGEIEYHITQNDSVNQCVVNVIQGKRGRKRIVAYISCDDINEQENLVRDLKQELKQYLPDYMLPYSYKVMQKLPLTPNGKIDHQLLQSLSTNSVDKQPYGPLN